MAKKRNQTFNFLYAIAILMVIDDHCGSRIGFLSSLFPYNSFYMPLFVFSSGYFYRKSGLRENLRHKSRRLLLPYTLWNIFWIAIAFLIDRIFGLNWVGPISFRAIVKTFFVGPFSSLNGPAWFIIMLFWVEILYNLYTALIDRLLPMEGNGRKSRDFVLAAVFCARGMISLYLSMKGWSGRNFIALFLLRHVFYFQFYHLGFIFRKYLENELRKVRKLYVCLACILLNTLLILRFGEAVNFYSTKDMASFQSWYLPLITSLSGILFYYEIASFLAEKTGGMKAVSFVAENTFTILETHLLFVNVPNFFVYLQLRHGSTRFADFDLAGFLNSTEIRYSPECRLIGFACGVAGSLLCAYALRKISRRKPGMNGTWYHVGRRTDKHG